MNFLFIFVLFITTYANSFTFKPSARCNTSLMGGVDEPSCRGFNFMEAYKNKSLESIFGEIWKNVVGYEGKYMVSNYGRIKSLKRMRHSISPKGTMCFASVKEIICSQGNDKDGYLLVSLSCKTYKTHRIVANAFLINPLNKPQINHIDGNKKNNHVSNLEWVTCKENINDADLKRLRKRRVGELNNLSKLRSKDIIEIRKLFESGLSNFKIGEMFGVGDETIRKIKIGKTWKHIK